MNRKYMKKYKVKVLKEHLFVLLTLLMVLAILTFLFDYILNGFGIEIVEYFFGWEFANILVDRFLVIMCIITFVICVISWIIVEFKAINKLAKIISQTEVLFDKTSDKVSLPADFAELEAELNNLKFEGMRNEELAKQEERRKTDMITYLAHDIKTPLASVIGYLNLLSEAPDMPTEQRAKYTDLTLAKAYRLEDLINEFFDITRFNLQSLPLTYETVDLSFMLNQMADEFYPMLQEGGRSAVVEVSEGLKIYCDSDKMARVFNNILKNAIAYSYPDSVIKISAFESNKKTIVKFENTGKVIPKENLDTIFDKFFRLDNSRSSKTGGAGLGLAIARSIVKQHLGSIYVTSENEITTFTVSVPAKQQ